MLVKHLRDDYRRPFATLVVIKCRKEIKLGISICHSKLDTFNKKIGTDLARARACAGAKVQLPNMWIIYGGRYMDIEDIIDCEIDLMYDRSRRYYKQAVDN